MSKASDYLFAFHSSLPFHDEKAARLPMHEEEHVELENALYAGTREQIARELADVVWIAYGTALVHGIDLDKALELVAIANMAKLKGGKMDENGKLQKPGDWKPPSLKEALL